MQVYQVLEPVLKEKVKAEDHLKVLVPACTRCMHAARDARRWPGGRVGRKHALSEVRVRRASLTT